MTALPSVYATVGTSSAAIERPSIGSGGITAVLMTSVALASCLSGTTTVAPWRDVTTVTSLISPARTTRGELAPTQSETDSRPDETIATAVASASASELLADEQEIRWVKEHSGLTWDQLGKVFGVSRRSVHLWANGGRMNQANATALREFAAAVRAVQGSSPDSTRAALLAVGPDHHSIVDTFRRRHTEGAWGSPFAPEELVGVIRDEAPQQT
jgi:DNA-binding XRE family transcriptional regulator